MSDKFAADLKVAAVAEGASIAAHNRAVWTWVSTHLLAAGGGGVVTLLLKHFLGL
jgi:hypothetical protein